MRSCRTGRFSTASKLPLTAACAPFEGTLGQNFCGSHCLQTSQAHSLIGTWALPRLDGHLDALRRPGLCKDRAGVRTAEEKALPSGRWGPGFMHAKTQTVSAKTALGALAAEALNTLAVSMVVSGATKKENQQKELACFLGPLSVFASVGRARTL